MKINDNSNNLCLFLFELQHQALVSLDNPGEIIVQIQDFIAVFRLCIFWVHSHKF